MAVESKRRFGAVVLAVAVFIVGVPAIAALLFFPVMYLAGAHTGVLSGPPAGAVWVAGVAAAIRSGVKASRMISSCVALRSGRYLPVASFSVGGAVVARRRSTSSTLALVSGDNVARNCSTDSTPCFL